MVEITQLLRAVERGDVDAADQLLPAVYEQLRSMAAAKLAGEDVDHTLQPTALVHEAWLKIYSQSEPVQPDLSAGSNVEQVTGHVSEDDARFRGRQHFFAVAAWAMRRILVDIARRKKTVKHGGTHARKSIDVDGVELPGPPEEVLALHESLDRLEQVDEASAKVVNLRYFGGLSIAETAQTLELSEQQVRQLWTYARAWLKADLDK